MRITRKTLLLAATAVCAISTTAPAQTAPVSQTSDTLSAVALADNAKEIIVTARKKEERLFDVPLTISVVGAEAIDRANLDNLDNLDNISSYRGHPYRPHNSQRV
jgi:iron complex outermembrane receptor protein